MPTQKQPTESSTTESISEWDYVAYFVVTYEVCLAKVGRISGKQRTLAYPPNIWVNNLTSAGMDTCPTEVFVDPI